MNLLEDFRARGLLHQASHEEQLSAALAAGVVTGYVGFDPTASSLHVGHLLPIMLLVRLQRAGHRPIALVGGATGLIGDPSGKAAERTMQSLDEVSANVEAIRAQLARFLRFDDSPTGAQLLNNHAWLGSMGLLAFLRDVGKHFSVNAMVQRDSVKNRLEQREQGISYTEFSYMLLQAYDFLALYDRLGCTLQMGGSDQWGNIVSGADLIRRLRDAQAFAITAPLLTRADGTKFGKSEGGNVWLDPALTSPYEFYQFWLNASDDDVGKLLRFFTLLPVAEIDALLDAHGQDPGKRLAQRSLAEAVTTLVHGAEGLSRAQSATAVLFGDAPFSDLSADELEAAFKGAPSHSVPRSALGTNDAALVELAAAAGLFKSKSEARTTMSKGGLSLNKEPVTDPRRALVEADLIAGRFAVLRKGKKSWHVVRVA